MWHGYVRPGHVYISRVLKINTLLPRMHSTSGGKVIGAGVHIYIYICSWTKTIFESYFSDRLTFSNIRSRTSR